ncbi:hypothetical protein GCM10010967_31600 [Dyadobacter beijingensis]|uniref:Uncharacterized protein n=2 Tax=Dyadobacter beijingensis TaxID=365489 RepID=A0ABQ2HZ60_9BACT|nr:hypothetical protein GCM10010967_31600 [Dyadobacter beijingensis]
MAGCQRIVAELEINAKSALETLVSELRDGDILVVSKAGHLGSQADFIQILIQAGLKHAHLVSLAEDIDTLRDSLILNSQAIR